MEMSGCRPAFSDRRVSSTTVARMCISSLLGLGREVRKRIWALSPATTGDRVLRLLPRSQAATVRAVSAANFRRNCMGSLERISLGWRMRESRGVMLRGRQHRSRWRRGGTARTVRRIRIWMLEGRRAHLGVDLRRRVIRVKSRRGSFRMWWATIRCVSRSILCPF